MTPGEFELVKQKLQFLQSIAVDVNSVTYEHLKHCVLAKSPTLPWLRGPCSECQVEVPLWIYRYSTGVMFSRAWTLSDVIYHDLSLHKTSCDHLDPEFVTWIKALVLPWIEPTDLCDKIKQ